MIKITHIEKNREIDIAEKIERYLKENFQGYCEIKAYHDGKSKPATYKRIIRN